MNVSKKLNVKIVSNIRRETQICFDVASSLRQQFQNVKDTKMFYNAMAREFLSECDIRKAMQ